MSSPISSCHTKNRSKLSRPLICAASIGLLATAVLTEKTKADAIIWNGDTSAFFSDPNNWDGSVVPGESSIATFNNPAAAGSQPSLDSTTSVQGLNFTQAGWTLDQSGANTLTVGTGGIATAGNGATTINAGLTQTGASTWALGAGSTLVLNGTTTLNTQPLITGAGNLVKGFATIGTGTTTTLSGSNTYTGTTTIRQGTLAITGNIIAGQNGAFGNATSAVILGDAGTLDATASMPQNAANSILLFNGTGATLFTRDIDATQATAGGRNRIAVSASGAASVETSGNVAFGTNATNTRRFEVGAAAGKTLTFSGIVSSTLGTTMLVNGSNFGTGTIRLENAANTYTGGTTVVNGFLSLPQSVASSGPSPIGTAGLTLGEGATPAIGAGGSALTNTLGFLMENGGTSFGRTISMTGGATSSGGVVNAYVVGGSNTSGTVTFANISSGTVANGDINLNLRVPEGGTANFTGVINDNQDLTRTTFVNINQVTNIAASGSGPGTVNGAVFGGTVILSGANSYQGGTYIRGGVAFANNATGSATGTGAVSVLGGTFGGTGAVSGAVTVGTGSTLAPGANGIDSLGTGALTLESGATLALEINSSTSAFDLLNVTGDFTLSLGNDVVLNVSDLGSLTLAPNTALVFVNYTGSYTGGLFTVNGTPIADDIGTFTVGANTFHIDYNHAGSVALVAAVPEPGSAMMAMTGLSVLLGYARRRKA